MESVATEVHAEPLGNEFLRYLQTSQLLKVLIDGTTCGATTI